MSDTVEINLVKPTHGFDASQEITKLTLRRPTGKEILACGYPFVLVRDGNLGTVSERVDVKAMTSLAAACCGVLTSSIERLDAVDIYELFESIRIFFTTASGRSRP